VREVRMVPLILDRSAFKLCGRHFVVIVFFFQSQDSGSFSIDFATRGRGHFSNPLCGETTFFSSGDRKIQRPNKIDLNLACEKLGC